jgi:hypothetical protein
VRLGQARVLALPDDDLRGAVFSTRASNAHINSYSFCGCTSKGSSMYDEVHQSGITRNESTTLVYDDLAPRDQIDAGE